MFKPVQMAKIAIMGLRKNQQTAVSVLHDMEILQLEPLSKEVSAIVKNERDNELTRQVSDELLRVKALMTVLPGIPVIARKRFDSIDDLLQTASSIDVDEQVANLEKEKESLLTEIKERNIDFVIVNGENAATQGVGLTKEICKDFFNSGVNVITTGNHVWDQKEIMEFIDKEERLLRPKNLFEPAPAVVDCYPVRVRSTIHCLQIRQTH